MPRSAFNILFAFSLSLCLVAHSSAQQSNPNHFEFVFSGETLSEALDRIIKKTDIDLVYDPQITQGIHIYKRISTDDAEDLLKRLLSDHELDYIILSSGTYVIVKSTRDGPFYGTFAGKIVDRKTGDPLQGATVRLVDASGGTSTNQSGNFSIGRLLAGTYQIIFSYVGYEPVSKTIQIRPDAELTERIALIQKPVDVLPVVVEAHQAKKTRSQISSVSTNSEWNSTGLARDAIRNLNLLPGIQYGLPLTDLHLQGGQQSEHRILLDGVPVYNPYSFGQMFSSFSPYAIDKVRVHKAGYGVQAGSQIAGLINLSHDLPGQDENNLIFQADPLSANVKGDLSFSTDGNSNLQIMTALRTNFWDLYKNPTFEETLKDWNRIDPFITNALGEVSEDASIYSPFQQDSDIQFFDYHLASEYQIDDFNSVSTSLYVAENALETRLLNRNVNNSDLSVDPYLFASEDYEWNNLTTQLSWDQMMTPRFDLSTQVSYSLNQFEHQNRMGTSDIPISTGGTNEFFSASESLGTVGRQLPTQFDGNEIRHFTLKSDASYSISPNLLLEGGIQFERITSGIDISNLSFFPARIDQSASLFSSYLNTKHTFGKYWNIEWGSRFTYSALSDQLFAEPRFSVQYDKTESALGYWSAKLSGGLYRQFINEFQITNSGPTSIVPSFAIWSLSDEDNIPKAWHLNGSYLLEPSEQTTLRMELYYKWQPITNITSYTTLNLARAESSISNVQLNEIRAFAETTDMRTYGFGVKLDQSLLDSKIKLIAGYDYSYSQINMQLQFGRRLPAPWNEPHRTQLRFLWWIVPDVTFTAKWQGIWGRTWAFRQSYYDFLRYQPDEISSQFSFDFPEHDNLSPFHQVDLSLIYQPTIGNTDLEFRLEFLNILNRKNTIEKFIRPVLSEDGNSTEVLNRNLPGFYPSASFQVKF